VWRTVSDPTIRVQSWRDSRFVFFTTVEPHPLPRQPTKGKQQHQHNAKAVRAASRHCETTIAKQGNIAAKG
jgi:hypothetical protein